MNDEEYKARAASTRTTSILLLERAIRDKVVQAYKDPSGVRFYTTSPHQRIDGKSLYERLSDIAPDVRIVDGICSVPAASLLKAGFSYQPKPHDPWDPDFPRTGLIR